MLTVIQQIQIWILVVRLDFVMNQSPHVSAGVMMEKSIRNCKTIVIYNAHELDRNWISNNGEIGGYLTDYAYKFAENEFSLSQACRIVNVSQLTYCVYTPDDMSKEKRLINYCIVL